MVEANPSLARSQRQAQRQAERMRIAVRVEAQRRAREEVKAKIRREGRVKLASVPSREITAQAEARLLEDVEYRASSSPRRRPSSSVGSGGHVVGCTQLETSEQLARACDARASI
jgi:hypothetical protein